MTLHTATDGSGPEHEDTFGVYEISEDESYTNAIVQSVADATGQDPRSMPQLARSVDPDAIDALFRSDSECDEISLTFRYSGCEVVLTPVRVCVRSIDR